MNVHFSALQTLNTGEYIFDNTLIPPTPTGYGWLQFGNAAYVDIGGPGSPGNPVIAGAGDSGGVGGGSGQL